VEDIRGCVAMLTKDGAAFQGSEGLVSTSFHLLGGYRFGMSEDLQGR